MQALSQLSYTPRANRVPKHPTYFNDVAVAVSSKTMIIASFSDTQQTLEHDIRSEQLQHGID